MKNPRYNNKLCKAVDFKIWVQPFLRVWVRTLKVVNSPTAANLVVVVVTSPLYVFSICYSILVLTTSNRLPVSFYLTRNYGGLCNSSTGMILNHYEILNRNIVFSLNFNQMLLYYTLFSSMQLSPWLSSTIFYCRRYIEHWLNFKFRILFCFACWFAVTIAPT